MQALVRMIAHASLPSDMLKRKLTFTGGEPILCRHLPKIIAYAHQLGLVTMLVTNGSLLTQEYLDNLKGNLDWLALSIDSNSPETLRQIGRVNGKMVDGQQYIEIAQYAKTLGMRIKINTVVNRYNCEEDMRGLLQKMSPERWKLLQVTWVKGQNDKYFPELEVTEEQFKAFVRRHQGWIGDTIKIIPEETDDIRGSYAMIDPVGRFFDSANGEYHFSDLILDIGLSQAFQQVVFKRDKFEKRGGIYDFRHS